MKKILLYSLITLLTLFSLACTNKNEKTKSLIQNETEEVNTEPLVDLSLYLKDVNHVQGYYGFISSYIFINTNKDLINYFIEQACNINFTEVLTEENIDEYDMFRNRTFSFYMNDDYSILLTLTDAKNMYVSYIQNTITETEENKPKTLWSYKAINPKEIVLFSTFTGLGFPRNHYWLATPVVTSYYPYQECHIQEAGQNSIIEKIIEYKAPLSKHFTEGIMFSGCITNYYGKINDYDVISVYINDMNITDENDNIYLVNGLEIYSLNEALNNNIIVKSDLSILEE